MWPCSSEDYDSGEVIHTSYSGLASLQSRELKRGITCSAYDNVYTFYAKSCAMFYHAVTLTSSFREGHDVSHDTQTAIRVISYLIDVMVSYRHQICPTFERILDQKDHRHNCALILSMSITYAASIQLLHISSDEDATSRRRRFEMARDCARLAVEVCHVDVDLLSITIWLPWYSAYEVLAWELTRLKALEDYKGADAVRNDIDGLIDVYKKFADHHSFRNNGSFRNLARFDLHDAKFYDLD